MNPGLRTRNVLIVSIAATLTLSVLIITLCWMGTVISERNIARDLQLRSACIAAGAQWINGGSCVH